MGYWGTGYMGPGNRICMWAWDMLTQDMLGLLAQDMWAQDIMIYAWDMLARDMSGWDTYVGIEYVGTRYAQDMLAWGMNGICWHRIGGHKTCMDYVRIEYVRT